MSSFCLYDSTCPYRDWQRMGRPKRAVFKYLHDSVIGDFYTLTYLPASSLLFISSQFSAIFFDTHIILNVNEHASELNIEQVVCYKHSDPQREYCLRATNLGIVKYLIQEGVLELVRAKFFMGSWTWNIKLNEIILIPRDLKNKGIEQRKALDSRDIAFNTCPQERVMVWMDNTDELNAAATRIQTVFRGWQTRMTYRFNPHTTLGRHIVLKQSGFL